MTIFHSQVNKLSLDVILNLTGGELVKKHERIEISGIATLKNAKDSDLAFLSNGKYKRDLEISQAGFCLIAKPFMEYAPSTMNLIVCENPYAEYAKIATYAYGSLPSYQTEIAGSARIHETAKVGAGASIGENVVIGKNVTIGENTRVSHSSVIEDNVQIGSNTIIMSNVTISHSIVGDNCYIYAGARIGQDGFGFAPSKEGIIKIPQLGRVIIGNNVEVGANSCIDRGAIEDTVIGDGTKIDNLAQIGHNCTIGKSSFICGQVGLAGSTHIGNFVSMGGQSGTAGHLRIGDGSMIAGQSGVMSDVDAKSTLGGTPAINIRDWHKTSAFLIKSIKGNK